MIGLYRGTSFTSRLIEWFTRSPYSHAAWIERDGSVIEAWQDGGVRFKSHFSEGHEPGTVIDLFSVAGLDYTDAVGDAREGMLKELGKAYDWRGCLDFFARRNAQNPNRWFCSELIFEKFAEAGIRLLHRAEPYQVSPALLSYSPLLFQVGRVVCGQTGPLSECISPVNLTRRDP